MTITKRHLNVQKKGSEEMFTPGAEDFSGAGINNASSPDSAAQNGSKSEDVIALQENDTASDSAESIGNTGSEEQNKGTDMSETEYKKKRRRAISGTTRSILVMLLLIVFACFAIYESFSFIEQDNAFSWIISLFFVVGGIELLVLILKAWLPKISRGLEQQRTVKEEYMSSLSEDEKRRRARKIKRAKIRSLVCVLLVSVSAAIPVAVMLFHFNSIYAEAEQLISEERFEEAEVVLKNIEDSHYRDTESLLLLCEAHRDYSDGNLVRAYLTMEDARFGHQSSEMLSSIETFRQRVKEEYDEWMVRRKEEYEYQITHGVPFLWMPEYRIGDTLLGKPSNNVRIEREVRKGVPHTVHYYDFYSGKKLIFTAKCVDGRVEAVWDKRNEPTEPYVPDEKYDKNHITPAEPSVDGFSDPEEFYEWYKDDFFEYYDAEDYYYEHGGE